MAKRFCNKVEDLRRQNAKFDSLFAEIAPQADCLSGFTGAINASNYIEKAEAFLSRKAEYENAVQAIDNLEKFSRNNLTKLEKWHGFVIGVGDEMTKAAKHQAVISQLSTEFLGLYGKEVVKNFAALQQTGSSRPRRGPRIRRARRARTRGCR